MNQSLIVPNKKRFGAGTVVAIAVVAAVGAFILGTRADNLMVTFSDSQNKGLPANLDYKAVEELYDKLREKYDGQLDAATLLDGAKKGLVEATGDPYTVYFTDQEAKEFMNDLEGSFSGIGAELDRRDNRLFIVSTLDDSPARKAGLMPNDTIVKVNDQETSSWTTDKAVSEIRGEKGTTVKLSILRDQELKEFSIVRDAIVAPSVKSEITADNIGYLRISRFAESNTIELAQKAADDFKAKGVKGVVLDLRGNGGGYLEAAQKISGLWLKDKVVVQERRDNKVIETLKSGSDATLEGMPTVVLVDGGSASASEIVAGALRDNNAAQLVGVKTFGKGSVQEIKHLPSGGELKVTIAKWFTPNGKNISKEGISPDIEVKLSEDNLKNNQDTQKDKAFELLKSR